MFLAMRMKAANFQTWVGSGSKGETMHYKNGRTAKAGDLVRGMGYNIKHEIVGLLICAQPANSACNCQVATVTTSSQVLFAGYPGPDATSLENAKFTVSSNAPSYVLATIEYGQLDAFVAIDPQTGDILAPDPEIV